MRTFRKILIVDDDPASQFLLKDTLQELGLSGTIVSLWNGKEALDYLQKQCLNENAASRECPDWILLDLNMPVMGGLEFLAILRQLEQHNRICTHISIVSSSSHHQDKDQVQRFGVNSYLLKPITEAKLKEPYL